MCLHLLLSPPAIPHHDPLAVPTSAPKPTPRTDSQHRAQTCARGSASPAGPGAWELPPFHGISFGVSFQLSDCQVGSLLCSKHTASPGRHLEPHHTFSRCGNTPSSSCDALQQQTSETSVKNPPKTLPNPALMLSGTHANTKTWKQLCKASLT